MIRITQTPAGQTPEWSVPDRSFVVESEMKLQLVDGQLSYGVIGVEQYEKTYAQEQDEEPAASAFSFVAYVGDQPAGEIRLSRNWNGYAYIDDLVVSQKYRRQGVARALVAHAIAWAQSSGLPGVMLETQNNNVAACRLYESCGFRLSGFDSALYQGLSPFAREVALFWYWHVKSTL